MLPFVPLGTIKLCVILFLYHFLTASGYWLCCAPVLSPAPTLQRVLYSPAGTATENLLHSHQEG